MDCNPRPGSVRSERAKRKIEPPLIFEIDKPNAVSASSQCQINTPARCQHKVAAVSVIVGEMKASIANKNLSICCQPSIAIWKLSSDEISRLMSAHLFIDG